jgi:GR25 family glycosyltransferase involved in LPS biosynthesis
MIKAYCINLDRKPENFAKVTKEFEGILDIERVSAIDGKEIGLYPKFALHKTQIRIFEKAVCSEEPYIIVIEDDIYKLPSFHDYWPKIVNFISTNSEWDFISLDFFLCDIPTLELYDIFFKTSHFRAAGFMIYNTNFLKNNLEYIKTVIPLDMTMTFNTDFVKLIPKHLIIRQYVDKVSETEDSDCNYELLYKQTVDYLQSHRIKRTLKRVC